ncbi:MAG TPA: FHA domain-containing protein [Burkholderiaceae bacterium]|nr:FHA domain-containing protein [Burkholderiaceae bacterium]
MDPLSVVPSAVPSVPPRADEFAAVPAFDAASPATTAAGPVAVVEILDRDGQVRQSVAVAAWPLRIGRALDNEIVLSDAHVAASHLTITRREQVLELEIGSTHNGVQHGRKHLRAGELEAVAIDSGRGAPIELGLGRTRLRIRLPDQPLAAEQPLAAVVPLAKRLRPIVIAAAVLLLALTFNTYLDTDPDGFGRALGNMLLTAVLGAAIWCGVWAMLSKIFTRQAHFGWHLRVFLLASIALLAVGALPALLAFSLSWTWLTDFAFVGVFVVGAAALYFHLLAVEPAKHRLLRWMAVGGAVAGIIVTMWFNEQRTDQLGDELYMNHLFPPALRLARPVPAERLVDGLTSLKATLDRKAKDSAASGGDDGSTREDD